MALLKGIPLIIQGVQAVEITEIGRYIIIQEEIRDPETDEVIQEQITEYQDGFRLAENITVTNAVIMPMRICIIEGDVSINTGGFWSNTSMVFRVIAEDLSEFEAEAPEQYNDQDIYWKPLLLDGDSLEMTLTQHQSIVDGDVGGFQWYSHHAKPRYTKPFRSLLYSWSEYQEYKHFLYRRAGRFREFWMPLYERHLTVLNDVYISTMLSLDTSYIVDADRNHIAVKRKNGTWTAHTIAAKGDNSMTVSPAINALINDIESIYYLGLYRFDADHIEFQFLGGGKSQVTVPIVEIEH